MQALLAVFKTRNGDPSREKDTGIEKCEVTVEDETGGVKSRFVVRLMCRHGEYAIFHIHCHAGPFNFSSGVLKVYRLTFEPTASIHAIFDASINKNRWEISSRTLREFVEHFGPGTEYLDIFSEDGRVSFISFTEKVVSGSRTIYNPNVLFRANDLTEVLRQPLHTSIAIDTLEFSHFSVEEGLHLVISVKDFKAIITHAGSISTTVVACYSYPSRPLQLKYSDDGITSEFILMTMGDFKGRSITPSIGSGRATSKRPVTRQALEASSNRKITSHSMAPPRASTAVRSRTVRPSPPPPQPSIEANAMFFTESDDDGRWDPVGSEEEREEAIGWNATAENVVVTWHPVTGANITQDANAISFNRTLHNHAPSTQGLDKGARDESGSAQQVSPTQRISQVG